MIGLKNNDIFYNIFKIIKIKKVILNSGNICLTMYRFYINRSYLLIIIKYYLFIFKF